MTEGIIKFINHFEPRSKIKSFSSEEEKKWERFKEKHRIQYIRDEMGGNMGIHQHNQYEKSFS